MTTRAWLSARAVLVREAQEREAELAFPQTCCWDEWGGRLSRQLRRTEVRERLL